MPPYARRAYRRRQREARIRAGELDPSKAVSEGSDRDEILHRWVILVLECGEQKITMEKVDMATVEYNDVLEKAYKLAVPEGATLKKNGASIETGEGPNHLVIKEQADFDIVIQDPDVDTFLFKVKELSGNHMEDKVVAEEEVHAEDVVDDPVMKWVEDNFGEGGDLIAQMTGNDELKEDGGSAVEREEEEVEVEVEQEVSEESHFKVESEEGGGGR